MKRAYLVLATSLFGAALVSSQNYWQQTNGPYGGWIYSIARNSSGELLAGTSAGGIFKSTDDGALWNSIGLTMEDGNDILVTSSGTLIVATMGSYVWISTNNGLTWSQSSSGLTGSVQSLLEGADGSLYACGSGGVKKSTDGGVNWTATTITEFTHCSAKTATGIIYVGTLSGTVYRSTDNGANWTTTASAGAAVRSVAVNSLGHLYAARWGSGGLLKSTDNGSSWQQSGLHAAYMYKVIVNSGDTVFAASGDSGISRSTDGGGTWSHLLNSWAYTVFCSPNGNIFAGTSVGILKSTDYGSTWEKVNQGITATRVNDLTFNSSGGVIAATGSGLFTSSDNGTSWQELTNGISGTYFKALARNSRGYIFVGTTDTPKGIFRSTDNGASWESLGLTDEIQCIAVGPGDVLYAGTTNYGATRLVLRSTDDGSTWTETTLNSGNPHVYSVIVNSSGHVFAGTAGSGTFKSTDAGTTWSQLSSAPGLVLSLAFNASGHLIAGGDNSSTGQRGVFRSTDGGNSWMFVLNLGSEAAVFRASNGHLYAGNTSGSYGQPAVVYRSTDGGSSWNSLNTGINHIIVKSFTEAWNGYVFLGSMSGGAYRTTNPIDTPPGAPTLISALPSSGNVRVVWSQNIEPDFLRYRIYGGQSLNPTKQIDSTTVGISDTAKTITGLTNGITYYFRVTAVDSAGNESGYSNELQSTPNAVAICVSTSGNDGNAGSEQSPLRNIQTALNRAIAGDTVKVAGGSYSEVLTTVVRVILRGGYTNTFEESQRDIFVNKTFLEGISTKMLTDNKASMIEGFVFNGTTSVTTAGIEVYNGTIFRNNIVRWINVFPVDGIRTYGGAQVLNNTIIDCDDAIVIFSGTGTPNIRNNIIIDSDWYGITTNAYSEAVRTYNDVYQSYVGNYSGGYTAPGFGDISLDPQFRDAANSDYRLRESSPCRDAGDPADPAGDEPIQYNSRIDMGVYGGTRYSPYLPPVPGAPVLAFPSNGATHQSRSVTLRWNRVPEVSTYRLQVASDPSFTSGMVFDDASRTDTSETMVNLNAATIFYWRVSASVTLGTGPYSDVFSFTTSDGVLCVSPSGNDANSGSVGSPLRNIQTGLNRAVAGDTIKVAGGSYSEVLTTITNVVLYGGYSGTFESSERDIFVNKTFIVGVSTTMLTDSKASTIDGFIFSANSSVAGTHVSLNNGSVFSHNVVKAYSYLDVVATFGGATLINNVVYGGWYNIRVYSGTGTPVIKNNIVANGQNGLYMSAYTYAVRPYNDVYGNWTNYGGTDVNPGIGDIVQDPQFRDVANNDFRIRESSPCRDAGDPADSPGEEPVQYNSRIDMGAYGGTRYSPYMPSVPGAPVLVSPANGATHESRSVTLRWNRVPEVSTYRLQVSSDPSFTSGMVFDDASQTDTSETMVNLNAATIFYWRVSASVTLGTGPYSDVSSFTTSDGLLCVSTSGSDGNSGSASSPLRNIQTALNRSVPGDTIKIAGGSYSEVLTTVTNVILRGGYTGTFEETGRDIFVYRTFIVGASTTMLTDSKASTIDGLVFNANSSVTATHVSLNNGSVFTHNIVKAYYSAYDPAIAIYGGATVVNNVVYDAYYGIRINSGTGTPIVKNNIVASGEYGMYTSAYTYAVRPYNDLYGNWTNYGGTDANPGIGDIVQDPLLRDVANNDFRIRELSPCRDAGDPADVVGEEPVQYNTRIDIGAYGGTKHSPYLPPIPGAPLLGLPANGAVHQSRNVTLRWNLIPEVSTYRLQVSTDPSFASGIVFDDAAQTDTSEAMSNLAVATEFYWRVSATVTLGTGPYSDVFSFTTTDGVLCVSPSGNDANSGAPSAPLQYIPTALNRAVAGDTIKIATGTYNGGVTTQCQVIIRGGYTSSFLETDRNVFMNRTTLLGISAVMLNDDKGSTIEGLFFSGSSSVSDAAIKVYNGSIVRMNVIRSVSSGNGIEVNGGATVLNNTVYGCTFGIYISSGTGTPIIASNIVSNGSWGMYTTSYSSAVRPYNNVYGNGFNYSGADVNPGIGDVGQSPQFVNAANNDFRLLPTSPCINAGDPNVQYNDPDGTRNDMGAFYYDAPPTAPQNVQAFAGVNSVTLNWQENIDPDFLRYRIYAGTSPAPSTPIDSISTRNTTSLVISNLSFGVTRYFRMKTIDQGGNESVFSNEVNTTPMPTALESDSLALVDLYYSTNGANWTNNANWLTGPLSTWYGVTIQDNRVSQLTLDGNNLSGPIPGALGELDSLELLQLATNYLNGSIPPNLGTLPKLRTLGLDQNQLTGSIPASLGNLTELRSLDLFSNQLSGPIPDELGNLLQLTWFHLDWNSGLDPGPIPSWVFNLTNLTGLAINGTNRTGTIPDAIGKLTQLASLSLSNNQLTGVIPDTIGSLVHLSHIWLNTNQLSGAVPNSFTNLSRLQALHIGNNLLDELPSLASLDSLTDMTVQWNRFTFEDIEPNIGAASTTFSYIPQDSVGTETDTTVFWRTPLVLSAPEDGINTSYQWMRNGIDFGSPGRILTIASIDLADSGSYSWRSTNTVAPALTLFGRPIHVSIMLTPLERDSLALVDLYNVTNGANWTNKTNWLTGPLNTWGGVTLSGGRVLQLILPINNLVGMIPASFWNLTGLMYINLDGNQLSGVIPSEIGGMVNLQHLYLRSNVLTGGIPSQISSLPLLRSCCLSGNQLTGNIPPELGLIADLNDLDLSNNQLTGSIPIELVNLRYLRWLSLGDNQLSGTIPIEIGRLDSLRQLYLHGNRFSGAVPDSITRLVKLTQLGLWENDLDHLPDLSPLVELSDLSVFGNRFTFKDIEPNVGLPSSLFQYSPQDSVGVESDTSIYWKSTFILSAPDDGTNTQYQWMHNGVDVGSPGRELTVASVELTDAGTYSWRSTNSLLPDLTLYGRPIHVAVVQALLGEYSRDANTVLLLHMNETSGSLVSDVSSFSNNGATVDGTTEQQSRFGRGRLIEITGSGISVPDAPSLNFGMSPFTVESWVKINQPATASSFMVLTKLTTNPYTGWYLTISQPTNNAYLDVFSGTTASQHTSLQDSRPLNDGKWHHLASTVSATQATLYVDGLMVATSAVNPQGTTDNPAPLLIGNWAGSWSVSVDEIRISNVARSPSEFKLQLPPVNVAATRSGTTIDLSWQNGGGAVPLMRYRIYRASDSLSVSLLDSTSSSSYQNSNLPPGTYFYRVSAVDSTGFEGAKSFAASATVVPPGSTLADYVFTATTGSFAPLTGATIPILTSGDPDEGYYDSLPLGFTFYYLGNASTMVSVSTNGWVSIGGILSSAGLTNNLTSGGTRPVIAPLWDDIEVGTFSYKTDGSFPSRVFTAEWLNVQWNWTATTPAISFQMKLYETTGKIEFIYRQESGSVVSGSASIGITAASTGSGNFLSLNNTGINPTVSSTTETTTLSVKPASGQIYTFTPQIGLPEPPILVTPVNGATGVSTSPILSWNAGSEAVSYRLQVATSASFSTNGSFGGDTPSAHVSSANLTSDQGRTILSNEVLYHSTSTVTDMSLAEQNPEKAGDFSALTLTGDSIIVRIKLQNLPGALTFSQSYVPDYYNDYTWSILFDADGNMATGVYNGCEIEIAVTHFKNLGDSPFTSDIISGTNHVLIEWDVSSGYWRHEDVSARIDPLDPNTLVMAVPKSWTETANIDQTDRFYIRCYHYSSGGPISDETSISTEAVVNDIPGDVSYDFIDILSGSWNTTAAGPTVVFDDSTITGTSRQVSALASSTTYYWRVSAKNVRGSGAFSSPWNFTTGQMPPEAPANLTATAISFSQINLSWADNSTNEEFFRIEQKIGSTGTYAQIDSVGPNVTSYQNWGLAPSTEYFYRVCAYNGVGTSAYSNEASATTLPAGITFRVNMRIKMIKDEFRPDLGDHVRLPGSFNGWNVTADTLWDFGHDSVYTKRVIIAAGEIQYKFFKTSRAGIDWETRNNRVYVYSGDEVILPIVYFDDDSVMPLPQTPSLAFPVNGAISQLTTLTLQWDRSRAAELYHVQVAADTTLMNMFLDDSTVTDTSQTLMLLSGNTAYYWRVRAKNTSGSSTFSSWWSFATAEIPTESQVAFRVNMSVRMREGVFRPDLGDIVTLRGGFNGWLSPSDTLFDADGDSIYTKSITFSDSLFGTTIQYKFWKSSRSLTDWEVNQPTSSQNREFVLPSINVTLPVVYFDNDSIPTSPGPPTAVAASNQTGSGFTAIWNHVGRATGYRLDVSTTSTFSAFVSGYQNLDVGLVSSRDVTGLNPGTTYYYRVRAYNGAGTSGNSNTVSASTLVFPATPTLLSPASGAVNQPLNPTLSWAASSGAATYRLQVSTSSLFTTTVFDDSTLTGTSQLIGPLVAGTQYFWHVRAKNASGSSSYSAWRSFTTLAIPVSPSNLTATAVSSTAINISWNDNSSAEDGFKLERRTGTVGTFAQIASLSAGTIIYLDTSLPEATTYSYRVRAWNSVGNSSYSNEDTARTYDITAPASPVNVQITPSTWTNQTQFTISWSNPSDASGIACAWYQIGSPPTVGSPGIERDVISPSFTLTLTNSGQSRIYFYLEDSSGNKNPSSAVSVLAKYDNVRPFITHDSTAVASFTTTNPQSIPINANATDAVAGIKLLQLQYRRSGTAWTSAVTVTYSNSSGGTANVSQTDLANWSKQGVDYRIVATDSANNVTASPTFSLQIRLGETVVTRTNIGGTNVTQYSVASLPGTTDPVLAYRMLSVPMDLDDKSPKGVLEIKTELGGYDIKKWRFYRLINNSAVDEYSSSWSNSPEIDKGKAFLLVLKSGTVIKTGSGKLYKAEDLAKSGLPLNVGYNFVGNPMNFDIPVTSLSLANGVSLTGRTFSFAGISGSNSGWQLNPTTLAAWEGIVIKLASGEGPTTLRFDVADRPSWAFPSDLAKKEKTKPMSMPPWKIRITAQRVDNKIVDRENTIGIEEGASDNLDEFDAFEPPLFGERTVSVSFSSLEGALTHDIRGENTEGYVWDMKVQSPDQNAKIQLRFDDFEQAPAKVYLIDLDTKMPHIVNKEPTMEINTFRGERSFRVIVGALEFAEKNSGGIDIVPKEFALFQNYPNPFNSETVIRYSLPTSSSAYVVSLKIYNMLGQEVETLVEAEQGTGFYEAKLDGRALTTGVYFCRMVVSSEKKASFSGVKRMMLLR